MSFDMLEESEKIVIYALSVFSEKGAKEEILAKVMGIDSNDYAALDDMTRIVEALIDLALVRPPEDGYYSMHNLIRLYARKKAEEAGKLREYQEQFVDTMFNEARKWRKEIKRTKEEGFSAEKYNFALKFASNELPNIIEAFNAARGLEKYQKAVNLALYSGSLLDSAALYDDTIILLELAKEIAESESSIEDEDAATTYNNLGLAYHHKGEYDKAIKYFEKSLNIELKALGEEHPNTAETYNNLGLAYHHKGEYDKAIKYFEKSLNIVKRVLGENHPYTAKTYNNLGMIYYSKGEYDKAIKYFEKALKIELKVLGEEHPDTAATYNNLGMIYYFKGEYDKAIKYFEKALKIVEKRLGECHPYTKITLENLLGAYKGNGDLENANKISQRLESLESKCGK